MTARHVRRRAKRDGTQHAAARRVGRTRLRSRPERVQREGDRAVGVAIVMYVSAQGLRVDEQVVDNCGFKGETERFQVVVR